MYLASHPRRLGNLLSKTGKSSEAEAEYRKALAIQQKLADDNPAVTYFRSNLALSHNILGWLLLSKTGRPSEAEAEFRKALAIQQKLADDNPAVTHFQRDLADRLFNQASRHMGAGNTGEAIGYLHAGRGDPAEARRGQLGNPSGQGFPGELPDQHGGHAPSVGEA